MSEVRGDYPKISTGHPDAGRAYANALDSSLAREAKLIADFDRVTAERDALQQRLTSADELNDTTKAELAWQESNNAELRKRVAELLIMLRMAWVDTEVSAENCRRIDAALKPAELPLPGVWLGEDCEQESREPGFSVHVHPAVRLGSGVCLSSYGHRGVPYEVASRSMTFVSMPDHKCPKKSYAVKAIIRGVKHPRGILVNGVIYYCAECKP